MAFRLLVAIALLRSATAFKDMWMDNSISKGDHQCNRLHTSFESAWIGNDLLKVERCPKHQAEVRFGWTELRSVGKELTPTMVQHEPYVSWPAKEDKLYAIFMIDPDAPRREDPKAAQWYHWGVVNIPGKHISKGDVVTEYFGSAPPPGTGLHRYVILIYEQNQRQSVLEKERIGMTNKGRSKRDIKDIAARFGLESPIAGACFQAQYDEIVPTLYAKMK